MAAREGGGGFNWFIIGFVVGVAATLAVIMWLNVTHDRGDPNGDIEPKAPEPASAPAAAEHARPAAAAIPVLPAAPKKTAIPERARASQRESDEQMAEDAAAAGMTSRSTASQPQAPVQAPADDTPPH